MRKYIYVKFDDDSPTTPAMLLPQDIENAWEENGDIRVSVKRGPTGNTQTGKVVKGGEHIPEECWSKVQSKPDALAKWINEDSRESDTPSEQTDEHQEDKETMTDWLEELKKKWEKL